MSVTVTILVIPFELIVAVIGRKVGMSKVNTVGCRYGAGIDKQEGMACLAYFEASQGCARPKPR